MTIEIYKDKHGFIYVEYRGKDYDSKPEVFVSLHSALMYTDFAPSRINGKAVYEFGWENHNERIPS